MTQILPDLRFDLVQNGDGTLGTWEPETSLPIPRDSAGTVLVGDQIVVLGGV